MTKLKQNPIFQILNLKRVLSEHSLFGSLGFRILNLFDIWCLGFGIYLLFDAWNLGFTPKEAAWQ